MNGDGRPDRTETIVGWPLLRAEDPQTSADLSMVRTIAPAAGPTGQSAEYSVTIANHGPAQATNVSLTGSIASLRNVSVRSTSGSRAVPCDGKCDLGTVAAGSQINVTFTLGPQGENVPTNLTVLAGEWEPDWTNNSIMIPGYIR
jgi:uncharacterized repeat protein (TIGR01451 family)